MVTTILPEITFRKLDAIDGFLGLGAHRASGGEQFAATHRIPD
jgi:hypothetical protein